MTASYKSDSIVKLYTLITRASSIILFLTIIQGQPVGDCDFQRRLTCIDKEIIGPRHEKIRQGRIDKNMEPFSVRKKDFWDIRVSPELLDGK